MPNYVQRPILWVLINFFLYLSRLLRVQLFR
jgi:hypothetical protein